MRTIEYPDRYSVVPWNGPIPLAIRGAAIPMICGSTVVLRPSEYSPRTQALVADAFHEECQSPHQRSFCILTATQAGLPSGVLNYIPISREDSIFLTPEIIAHPFVRKITVSPTSPCHAEEAAMRVVHWQ